MPREFQGSTKIKAGDKITMSQLPIRLRRHPEFVALRPLLRWAINHYIEPIRMGVEMEVDWEVDMPYSLVDEDHFEDGECPDRTLAIHYTFSGGEGVIIQHSEIATTDVVSMRNGIVVKHWLSGDLEERGLPDNSPSIYSGPGACEHNRAWYDRNILASRYRDAPEGTMEYPEWNPSGEPRNSVFDDEGNYIGEKTQH